MKAKKQRVAAYGVCINGDDEILLARWLGPKGKRWILPGGGLDHGEHPHDAVIREFEEETGFAVEVLRLLGIDSELREEPDRDYHALRILYEVRIVGGELRYEVDGTTDLAQWFPVADIERLERVPSVDTAMGLYRTTPPAGILR
ncbi:ADP-ribose pyrophosphatase YjhB, NUDIX family [Lentzea xinjiangensis]|uniref:ADP-ribose pyrophosphatase YjhB, NUDIX family n=1 Tax=Lentzea xinjiangensis TaxID=402600 RepID=A0A1H9TKT0_9PSEU|nr:NUDIX hydrolase [Lentzea xinjiangensis]SER97728.1 ADP-ribose pyrophosphatase YjhB, NUDIX family [Lentzea xinjiangensis]